MNAYLLSTLYTSALLRTVMTVLGGVGVISELN